jgi:hypothetical protein
MRTTCVFVVLGWVAPLFFRERGWLWLVLSFGQLTMSHVLSPPVRPGS